MANAAVLIDIVTQDYDGVDPTDADNTPLRLKYLRFLQHVYNYVWSVREWEWTYAETAITILAGGNSVSYPATFLSVGSHGSLFDTNRRTSLLPRAKWLIERVRREGAVGGLTIDCYSIWGGKIQIPYTVSANTPFLLFHRIRPETLVDDRTVLGDLVMPDKYGVSVLLPALVWRSQNKKQDSRGTWGEQFQAGLSQMAADENPLLNEPMKMPLARRGVW